MNFLSEQVSPSFWAPIASILTVGIVYYHIKVFTFWSSRGVKGPTPWPIFGTLVYYIFSNKIDVDTNWRKKYGRTYGLYEGYSPVLRTTDSEIIKQVLIKQHSSMTDRNINVIMGRQQRRWLFWSKGNHWSNQRVLMTPMMSSSRLKAMLSTMSDCSKRFLHEIENRLANGSADSSSSANGISEKNSYCRDDLMSLTLDTIARSFFSLKLNTYRDKSSDFFKRAFAFAHFHVYWFAIWLFIPSPIARYFEIDLVMPSQFNYFEELSQKLINERRQNPKLRQNDFVQGLMEAKLPDKYEKVYTKEDEVDKHYNSETTIEDMEKINENQSKVASFRKFDDNEIRAQMTFFFLGGFETTSSTLSLCFFEFAHQPSCQEEVYQEMKSISKGDSFSYDDIMSLKKLDAFVSEVIRLYSPVIEHNRMVTTKEGVTLGSNPPIHLPYKTAVSINAFVTQRDEEYWPNPLKFDKSRFYPEDRDKIVPCSYVPFGAGPRNCIGMRFALLNIKNVLATTLMKYKVSPSTKTKAYPPSFNRHAFFLQLTHTEFLLEPRKVD